jgi:cytochrome P450
MTAPTLVNAPGRLPLIGHGLPLLRDPLRYMESLRDLGDVVKIYIGRTPAYVVTDIALARGVLLGEAGTFTRDNVADRVRVLFGDAVATLAGGVHRDRRRLLAPSFHHNRIADYATVMARVADEHVGSWRDGQRLDFADTVFDLSLATISATLFSYNIGRPAVEEIHRSLPFALREIPRRVLKPAALLELPTPANRKFEAAALRMRTVFRRVIEEYRAKGADRGDLLSTLLFHPGPGAGESLSDDQVEDELMGLLVAGVDTPAATVAWVFHELGRNPDAARKIRAEIDEQVGDGPVTPAHVHSLTYTRLIVQETLRMYAAWINLLQSCSPVNLAGLRLPAGTTVAVSPHMLHRDPRLFEHPDSFDPNRWSTERVGKPDAGAAIPFGVGTRRCPGDFFALTEMTIQVATIARRWDLEPVPGIEVRRATQSVVVHPERLPMIVRAREHAKKSPRPRQGWGRSSTATDCSARLPK